MLEGAFYVKHMALNKPVRNKVRSTIEAWWPMAFSILSIYLIINNPQLFVKRIEMMPRFYEGAFGASGVLLGFLIAVFSILQATDNRAVKFLKDAGRYKNILRYLWLAMFANFLLLLVSLLMMMINQEKLGPELQMGIENFSIWLAIWMTMLAVRFTFLFVRIVT